MKEKLRVLTEAQANLIQELELDPETVTFKKPKAVPPCQVVIHDAGGSRVYWIYRDTKSGKLKLNDEKPSFTTPRREGEDSESDTPEVTDQSPSVQDKVDAQDEIALQKAGIADADVASHGATRNEVEAWLKECGLAQVERTVVLARHFENKSVRDIAAEVGKGRTWVAKTLKRPEVRECLKSLRSGNPLPQWSAATTPNEVAQTAATDAAESWTLPEAIIKARRKIANYLPSQASDLGNLALGMGKAFASENRRVTEEQMERLESLSPTDRIAEVLPPGVSFAEAIACHIRLNPRSLLKPEAGERLVAAVVDLLEAVHFGSFEHRFEGLLPKDDHKLAVANARKALNRLVGGSQGSPREYPTHVLAGAVGIIQVALAPLQRAWRKMVDDGVPKTERLKAIRHRFRAEAEVFGRAYCPAQPQEPTSAFLVEVENLTDGELQSRLSNNAQAADDWKTNLLMEAARLAEKATGMSFKSFVRAWQKEPTLRRIYEVHLRR